MDIENIHDLKYSEMQKLAKKVGIKANMKFDRLKTALIEYHSQQEDKENNSQEKDEGIINETESENIQVTVKTPEETAPKGRRRAKPKRTTKAKALKQPKKAMKGQITPNISTPVIKSVGSGSAKPLVKKTPYSTPVSVLQKTQVKTITPVIAKIDKKPKTAKFTPTTTSKDTKYTPLAVKNKNLVNTPVGSAQKRKMSETTDKEEKPAKRTRMSFEKCELPAEPSPRPASRRSTYSVEKAKKQDKKASVSPGVQDLVSAMNTEKSDEEMKKNLIKALDKKVQGKAQTMVKPEKPTAGTQIPRFAAFLEKKRQQQSKPITPGNKDWTKIHQKEFDKFDSIDVYLEKKRKHREDTIMSVKKAKLLVEQTKEAIKRLQNHKTPAKENKPRKSKNGLPIKSPGKTFKPTVFSTKQINLNFSQTRKSPRSSSSVFNPTVTSTDKMNLNFGEVKTPSSAIMKTPKTNPRKSTGSMAQRKSIVTPFKFNATLNNTIDLSRSVKKPAFDLKASLSRPMTWKSHKGKLKSVKETYVSDSAKSTRVQAREERRISAMNSRTEIKFNNQMARRGVAS